MDGYGDKGHVLFGKGEAATHTHGYVCIYIYIAKPLLCLTYPLFAGQGGAYVVVQLVVRSLDNPSSNSIEN